MQIRVRFARLAYELISDATTNTAIPNIKIPLYLLCLFLRFAPFANHNINGGRRNLMLIAPVHINSRLAPLPKHLWPPIPTTTFDNSF
jgi:hypothetical protein